MEIGIIAIVIATIIGIIQIIQNWKKTSAKDISFSEELSSRSKYIDKTVSLILKSTTDFKIVSSKFSRSEASEESLAVNNSIIEHKIKFPRSKIDIILGYSYDRLHGAIELFIKSGVNIRFDPELHLDDMNYACFEPKSVLIGIRSSQNLSQKYVYSKSWIYFESFSLHKALKNGFISTWEKPITRSIGLYLREIIPEAIRNYENIEKVAQDLHIDVELIRKYANPKPIVILLGGKPGSGKTTISNKLKEVLLKAKILQRTSIVSDLEFIRRIFEENVESDKFIPTEDNGYFITDPSLYKDAIIDLCEKFNSCKEKSDLILIELARNSYREVLDIFDTKNIHLDLFVYLDINLELAEHRNKVRSVNLIGDNHYVSKKEMREYFAFDDFEDIKLNYNKLNIISIKTDNEELDLNDITKLVLEKIKGITNAI